MTFNKTVGCQRHKNVPTIIVQNAAESLHTLLRVTCTILQYCPSLHVNTRIENFSVIILLFLAELESSGWMSMQNQLVSQLMLWQRWTECSNAQLQCFPVMDCLYQFCDFSKFPNWAFLFGNFTRLIGISKNAVTTPTLTFRIKQCENPTSVQNGILRLSLL